MHSNKILPRNADIKPYMVSNADVGTPQERFLSEFPNLPGTPTLIRCSSGKTAQPQFEYSYVIGNIAQDAALGDPWGLLIRTGDPMAVGAPLVMDRLAAEPAADGWGRLGDRRGFGIINLPRSDCCRANIPCVE